MIPPAPLSLRLPGHLQPVEAQRLLAEQLIASAPSPALRRPYRFPGARGVSGAGDGVGRAALRRHRAPGHREEGTGQRVPGTGQRTPGRGHSPAGRPGPGDF